MDTSQILAAILLSVLHFLLAGMLLDDISKRKRILGGKKAPWIIAILFLVFAGAILYLLCHPRIFYGTDDD